MGTDLSQLDFDNLSPADLDKIDINDIDPKSISTAQFSKLLSFASAGTEGDAAAKGLLSRMSPDGFARLISRASKDQMNEVMGREELRGPVLDEIFTRMEKQFRPDKAKRTNAVVHWNVGDKPGGGFDTYEVIIAEGTCTVNKEPVKESTLAITVGPLEFLKVVSGNSNPVMAFMTGKLKAKGDLGVAANMTTIFDLPKA